jgi:hypothetical protein
MAELRATMKPIQSEHSAKSFDLLQQRETVHLFNFSYDSITYYTIIV